MIEQILDLVRGLVRPVALVTLVGALIGFLAAGNKEAAQVILGPATFALGYWFKAREK